jgi:hypothetical protein
MNNLNTDDQWNMLSMALSSRIVIDTLIGFYDGKVMWTAAEEGIRTIEEVREILRHLYDRDKVDPTVFWSRQFTRFNNYNQQKFLLEVAEEKRWMTWEDDLEQWMTNKEILIDYFSAVEAKALAYCRHGRSCI